MVPLCAAAPRLGITAPVYLTKYKPSNSIDVYFDALVIRSLSLKNFAVFYLRQLKMSGFKMLFRDAPLGYIYFSLLNELG